MNEKERLHQIDQEVCREIIRRPHAHGYRTGVAAGETVNITVQGEAVSAVVEQRHLTGVQVFLKNYPGGKDADAIQHVSFIVEPATSTEGA